LAICCWQMGSYLFTLRSNTTTCSAVLAVSKALHVFREDRWLPLLPARASAASPPSSSPRAPCHRW
jgi:hypothetical protein